MDTSTRQIFEDELVMSMTISRPSSRVFSHDNEHIFYNGTPLENYSIIGVMGGSPTIFNSYSCGILSEQKEFEDSACSFLQVPEILVFPSYEALTADFASNLLNDTDAIIYDEFCNPSLMRGIRLSSAEKLRYRHNDMLKLEDKLKLSQTRRIRLIVTDGIFPESGQCANLSAIKQLAEKYNAVVILDDSYGFLACGSNGRGSDEHCGVRGFADLKIVDMRPTLKASNGAFVCGDSTLIELLRRRSVSLRYSPSVQPGTLGCAAYTLNQYTSGLDGYDFDSIHETALRLFEQLREMGFNPEKPCASIVSFTTDTSAERLSEIFLEKGWLCEFFKHGAKTTAVFRVNG